MCVLEREVCVCLRVCMYVCGVFSMPDSYRTAISARKASGESAIPHIGVILKDITFIDVRADHFVCMCACVSVYVYV